MAAFGYFVWAILCWIYRAWLGSVAWGMTAVAWFGIPSLSVPMVLSLGCVAALLFSGMYRHDERTDAEKAIAGFVLPTVAFGFFWAAMQFV